MTLRTATLALAGVAAFLSAATAVSHAGNGQAIFREAERVRSPDLSYIVDFDLHVFDPGTAWKERTARYTMIAHGKDHSLVLMRHPKQFYPGTLLIADGRYWLLLPRSARPFQLSPRHVLNGDVSNGDLARGNLVRYYKARLDGEEDVRGDPCHRLELERTSNLGMYKRIRYWVTKKGNLPRKFEYFGNTDALLKVAYYEDYQKGEIGLRSMRVDVENGVRPGERSTLTFGPLRPFDPSSLIFDRDTMIAFRDAALAETRESGEQADAARLLELLRDPDATPEPQKRRRDR